MAYIINDTLSTHTDGRASAKLFDPVSCGGYIIQGATYTWIENLTAARYGHIVKCRKGIKRIRSGSDSTRIEYFGAARFGDIVE